MPVLVIDATEATVKDARIYDNAPNTNEGAGILGVGENNTVVQITRTLIQFDLSAIPDGSLVHGAWLSLRFRDDRITAARTYRVFRLKRDWVEGTGNGSGGTPDGVTWNTYDGSNSWQTAGAFGVDDCEQTDIGSTVAPASLTMNYLHFALNATTKEELDLGHGWLLKADTESNDLWTFYGSNDATPANRPQLIVAYSEPGNDGDVFVATKDAFVNSGTPTANWGASTQCLVGKDSGGSSQTGFIQFDISSIPANQVILSASLLLTCGAVQNTSQRLDFHRLLLDWTEGTGVSGQAGDVSWAERNPGVAWNSGGARGSNTDRDSTVTATINGTDLVVGRKFVLDVLVDVEDWYNGLASNNGWTIDFNTALGNNTMIDVRTRHISEAEQYPMLFVEYAPAVNLPAIMHYYRRRRAA